MSDVAALLIERLQEGFDIVSPTPGADPVLRPSERADYQANGALPLAKVLGRSPREVAEAVVAAARLDDICEQVQVSGPGFINLTLSVPFLERSVEEMARDEHLGVRAAPVPETVVVDYSGPNVAKEMHVGHLRSTVLGDALCRILVRLGHRVVRENHVGDWGTPFGMLIEHLLDLGEGEAIEALSVGDLNPFYQAARRSFDEQEEFRERSRKRVVLLQSGDPETLRLWHVLVDQSVSYFDEVYSKLDVLLTDGDIRGESFYNALLPSVVADLDSLGLLVDDEGARCSFPAGFTNRDGDPLPLIVQKSDGGYGYAATDLACIRDRVDRLGADRILYVVGTPQAQHLEMCFAVARMAGWLPAAVSAQHVNFGHVLGTDHKMLRTRAGASVKLVDLLDEAVLRASAAISTRHRDDEVSAAEMDDVTRAVGIGAVKYADLSNDRTRDYVFDWDRMLAFEGDTGPYLQYAHARIRSIFRRAPQVRDAPNAVVIAEPEERALALALLGYPAALEIAAQSCAPSKLCAYLHSLASTFTSFYERCPVLRATEPTLVESRLELAGVTARVLSEGLGVLGIHAPERM